MLNLDPSIMSAWTQRVEKYSEKNRKTPSPFVVPSVLSNSANGINIGNSVAISQNAEDKGVLPVL